jgi:hypothetical protein
MLRSRLLIKLLAVNINQFQEGGDKVMSYKKLNYGAKVFVLTVLSVLMVISYASVSYAEWSYGIGTGFFRLNAKGDQGFNTQSGAVEFKIDLDPDDFSDLAESAFGFAGYATDGTWMVQYSFSNLELEDTTSSGPVSVTIGFDMTGAEITVGHPVYRTPKMILGVLGGVRYTKHELSADVTVAGGTVNWSIDNDWTDLLVGLTLAVPLAEKWVWNNRVDAGFGGSEGTYSGNTGVTWRFYKGWAGTLYGKYTAVDFENGSRGDSDWYLYDVDEFGVGLAILYNF